MSRWIHRLKNHLECDGEICGTPCQHNPADEQADFVLTVRAEVNLLFVRPDWTCLLEMKEEKRPIEKKTEVRPAKIRSCFVSTRTIHLICGSLRDFDQVDAAVKVVMIWVKAC